MDGNHHRVPRRWPWLVAASVLALGLAYQGVMAGVRRYVDGRIESSVGKQLPAFRLNTSAGATVASESLRGKRVVLHFFRSRCHSCTVEAPAINAFAAELERRDDVTMLSVCMDPVMQIPGDETRATIARYGYRHPVLLADAALADAFHGAGWSQVTPITYVADATGAITHALRGAQSLEALRAAVR